ncbi:F/Y rich C-terminus-domain-containing protein [Collybia nuda]|uniref:F/Y rich C-terminus-domain-containing protein n=1 Tax=Collybia nuda TaxID=64659 RepID=A0A9P5YCQ2_9AGAR|nr:F/Y rich C-terminus-domain-containing protein [Collybia nuda]
MYPTSPTYVSPSTQRPPSEVQRQAKPKRLKAHTVTSKNFSIPMVPRDKRGKPMLPLNVGIMTVINLGDVCMREHFHTERYIFPVGYEVTRRYLSTVDPTVEVVYHCTILDGGDGPKFQIVPSDVPDRPVIAGTATGAWSNIVKQANAIRNRQHSNSVSGPDFFGLGQNTIKHLIQELPNADRLRDYVWQNFIEGGPLGGRHAAVIPALPEEYDASMPIGAYYPSEREKLKRAGANADAPRGMSHYPQHIIAQAEAERAQHQALAQSQAQQSNSQQAAGQHSTDQQQQPGGAQTASTSSNSDPTNVQNYHQGGPSRNSSTSGNRGSSNPAQSSRSSSEQPHAAQSNSQSQPPPGGPHHSPYVGTANPPPAPPTSVPAVPATFASIMNAYPAPGVAGPNE